MTWLKAIAAELLGLFVDDGLFALAILAWIVGVGFILPRLGLPLEPLPFGLIRPG